MRLDAKTAKTNADKAQLFAESVERHFGIQSDNFDSNYFDEVNQFIEDNYEYFYPPEDPDDYRSDMDDDHDLVADIDSDTLIRTVKFLKRGKVPSPGNIHNEVLRVGTTTSLFHHLARLFTSSIQIGYIPTAWKLATVRMLLKPDKLPSLTTSYRPISLMSSIMKLFERVIKQRLLSYLEDIGFINKYQLGFRQNKSTDDHLFRLSQSVMESFNRGEHVVAGFLDEEKAFDNVWHNGLRYKLFMLDLPTKMTDSVLSPLLFLIYVNDLPKPHHRQNSKSQFADDTALWAAGKNVQFAAKILRKDLRKLAKWCAKWRIKLNPDKTTVIIYSPGPLLPEIQTQNLSSCEIFRNYFRLQIKFQKHFEEILERCNTRHHRIRLLVKKRWRPIQSTILPMYKQMCPANFRIWLLDHNNIGHNHQQNSTAPEQIYPACPAFTKIH